MNNHFEPTANKLRPKSFSELVGQDFFVSAITGSLSRGERAHAYLLSGPRGVGKTSAARLLALAINRPSNTDIDNLSYQGSDDIRFGKSLDVIEIDGASYTSVENVRNIREEVLYEPVQFENKIYIIDEVHMLSHSAFNALLKTIEEPPKYVVFIFATTELQKIPATIRSRCQQYAFKLIHQTEIFKRLVSVCKERSIIADEEALHWMAKEAQGSLRDAYTLFDQIASFYAGKITLKGITKELGLAGLDAMNELFVSCVEGRKKDVLLYLAKLHESGVSVEQIVFESSEYMRTVLLIQSGIEIQKFLGTSKHQFDLKVLEGVDEKKVEWMLGVLLQCHRSIKQSSQQRFELELAFSELCSVAHYVSPIDLAERLESIKNDILFPNVIQKETNIDSQSSTENVRGEKNPSIARVKGEDPTSKQSSSLWKKLLNIIQDRDEKLLVFLEDVNKEENNITQLLTLHINDDFAYNMLLERKEILQESVRNSYGTQWSVALIQDSSISSVPSTKIKKAYKNGVNQDVQKKQEQHKDYPEGVQNVLSVFGGTVREDD